MLQSASLWTLPRITGGAWNPVKPLLDPCHQLPKAVSALCSEPVKCTAFSTHTGFTQWQTRQTREGTQDFTWEQDTPLEIWDHQTSPSLLKGQFSCDHELHQVKISAGTRVSTTRPAWVPPSVLAPRPARRDTRYQHSPQRLWSGCWSQLLLLPHLHAVPHRQVAQQRSFWCHL